MIVKGAGKGGDECFELNLLLERAPTDPDLGAGVAGLLDGGTTPLE